MGEVSTYSAVSSVTDSAASATALATGNKTNNGYIGMNPDGNAVQNIMELSKIYGRKTAMVTTDKPYKATPASFSAHTNSRSNTLDILENQTNGIVDLIIGRYSFTYHQNKEKFVEGGYKYAKSFEELIGLPKNNKIIGNLNNIDSKYSNSSDSVITLKDLVGYTLNYLTNEKDSLFTLMIEGAYIDKHSHNKDLYEMIYVLLDFNDAIEYILEWASSRDDTVIIITADYETGSLEKALSKDLLTNDLYKSSSDTNANVPLYIINHNYFDIEFNNTDVHNIATNVILEKS